jgi:pilus assembly protein Flp/PilA
LLNGFYRAVSLPVKVAPLTFLNGWPLECRQEAKTMRNMINRFRKDQSAATSIEYGIIVTLLALSIVLGVSSLGNEINNKFVDTATKFGGAFD